MTLERIAVVHEKLSAILVYSADDGRQGARFRLQYNKKYEHKLGREFPFTRDNIENFLSLHSNLNDNVVSQLRGFPTIKSSQVPAGYFDHLDFIDESTGLKDDARGGSNSFSSRMVLYSVVGTQSFKSSRTGQRESRICLSDTQIYPNTADLNGDALDDIHSIVINAIESSNRGTVIILGETHSSLDSSNAHRNLIKKIAAHNDLEICCAITEMTREMYDALLSSKGKVPGQLCTVLTLKKLQIRIITALKSLYEDHEPDKVEKDMIDAVRLNTKKNGLSIVICGFNHILEMESALRDEFNVIPVNHSFKSCEDFSVLSHQRYLFNAADTLCEIFIKSQTRVATSKKLQP